MTALFPSWPLLTTFILASLVLAVTPGPGVFYIVTRSLIQGRLSGLVSVAGVALGNLGNAFAAAIGLSALFAFSATAFTLVKYAGAVYLAYLGVKMLRYSHREKSTATPSTASYHRIFLGAFIVALFNPKTTMFFAAFLPQFLSPDVPPIVQTIVFGTLFVAIAAITDCIYAVTAGTLAPKIAHSHVSTRIGHCLGGSVFIALGIFTALTGSRAPK